MSDVRWTALLVSICAMLYLHPAHADEAEAPPRYAEPIALPALPGVMLQALADEETPRPFVCLTARLYEEDFLPLGDELALTASDLLTCRVSLGEAYESLLSAELTARQAAAAARQAEEARKRANRRTIVVGAVALASGLVISTLALP
jgi:hypothetical protein